MNLPPQMHEPADIWQDLDEIVTPGAYASHIQLHAASMAYQQNITIISETNEIRITDQFSFETTMYVVYRGGVLYYAFLKTG